MFALLGLLIDVRSMVPKSRPATKAEVCQGAVKAEVILSREQLAKLLTVPERDAKAKVRDILKDPYCNLPNLEVRAGVVADRETYPLAFDPKTWLVVLYEGDEYAGYQFSFR